MPHSGVLADQALLIPEEATAARAALVLLGRSELRVVRHRLQGLFLVQEAGAGAAEVTTKAEKADSQGEAAEAAEPALMELPPGLAVTVVTAA
jgi:hypothetical protein